MLHKLAIARTIILRGAAERFVADLGWAQSQPRASRMGAFNMGRAIYLLLLIVGVFTAAADANVLNNSDFEYLSILIQKGTQIVVDIRQSDDALNSSPGARSEIVAAYCLERLRNDMEQLTLEGDHLQSVVAIARRMVDPKDEEITIRFVKTIAEAASRKVQPLRDDVRTIIDICPIGTAISANVRQVLSFMDDFANVVGSIARRIK
jgi:hypothetical protein